MHLLQLLRQLSQGGRAIVTTIHQPSSRLYQQLDKLLLLSQVSLYQGPAQQFRSTIVELMTDQVAAMFFACCSLCLMLCKFCCISLWLLTQLGTLGMHIWYEAACIATWYACASASYMYFFAMAASVC